MQHGDDPDHHAQIPYHAAAQCDSQPLQPAGQPDHPTQPGPARGRRTHRVVGWRAGVRPRQRPCRQDQPQGDRGIPARRQDAQPNESVRLAQRPVQCERLGPVQLRRRRDLPSHLPAHPGEQGTDPDRRMARHVLRQLREESFDRHGGVRRDRVRHIR